MRDKNSEILPKMKYHMLSPIEDFVPIDGVAFYPLRHTGVDAGELQRPYNLSHPN